MSRQKIIYTMCEDDAQALNVVLEMLNDIETLTGIMTCDLLNIRGTKLYKLYNECCSRNLDKFKRTLKMFDDGVFPEYQIDKNLELPVSLPFIDDCIKIDGVPEYGQKFDQKHQKWNESCLKNQESFIRRLDEKLTLKQKIQ